MRTLILLAATTTLAVSMPALAKPGHGNGHGQPPHAGSQHRACPPGLAAKHNGCLPPGQARKLFSVGQRIPAGYHGLSAYGDIPLAYRQQHSIPSGQNYIYRDQTVYVVDPRTRLVTRIFELLH